MTLALVREWARTGDSRRATSCSPSSPTRRPAAGRARTTWSTTTPTCSPTAPRRSARSAASASSLNDQPRLYLIQTAEKGINWLRLRAGGRPGHGSMVHDDNAVTRLAAAVVAHRRVRVAGASSPTPCGPCRTARRGHRAATSTPTSPSMAAQARQRSRMIGAALRNTANPTMLAGRLQGQRHPVAAPRRPSTPASCPARRTSCCETIDELIGEGVERETDRRRHRRGDRVRRARWSTRWSRR